MLTMVNGYKVEGAINRPKGYYDSWVTELEVFVENLVKSNAPEGLVNKYKRKIQLYKRKAK